jgi:hypothetical protein
MDGDLRIGVCQYPPFTYAQAGAVFGPWVTLIESVLPKNVSSRLVVADAADCNAAGMLRLIAAGAIDVAAHPMLIQSSCDGCVWSYPLSSNGLVVISGGDSVDDASVFLRTFTPGAWVAIACTAAVFVTSAVVMERRRAPLQHIPYSFLTLFANLHIPDAASAGAYMLYAGMVVCSMLLLALYTADMTANVLQDKVAIGHNVRWWVNSGRPFNVLEGGPHLQMGYEYPDARYTVVSADDGLERLPTLALWEHGEMLVSGSCDPVSSSSGAINRLAYGMAFRAGAPRVAEIDAALMARSLADEVQSTMVTWIPQRYTCADGRAVQISSKMLAPLMYVSFIVYAVVLLIKVGAAVWGRRRPTGVEVAPPDEAATT